MERKQQHDHDYYDPSASRLLALDEMAIELGRIGLTRPWQQQQPAQQQEVGNHD
jgi:hypothetical protein